MPQPHDIEELARIVESSLRELNSAMTKTEALAIRIGRRTTQIIRFSMAALLVLGIIMFYLLYILTRDMGAMATSVRVMPAMNDSVAGMRQNMADMGGISTDVRQLMDQHVRPLLDNLRLRIDGAGSVETQATALIQDLRKLTAKLNESADFLREGLGEQNRRHLTTLLGNVNTLTENFLQVSNDARGVTHALDHLVVAVDGLVADNRQDLRATVQELRATMHVVAQSVDALSHRLDGASRNLNEFSRQVRENPTVLLGITRPAERALR
jgi:hypothetical protein